jgi:hypothetical protein
MVAEILRLPIDMGLSLERARARPLTANPAAPDLAPGLLGLSEGSDGGEDLTL